MMRIGARSKGRIEIPKDSAIVLDHVQLRGEDYSKRNLMQFCTIGCRLEQCRFDRVRIEDTQFGSGREMSEFIDCSFDGAHLDGGGGYTRFVRCSFRDVDMRNWFCFAVEMIDCVFTGRLRRCVFNGTPLDDDRSFLGRERNEFHGNDFFGVDLVDVAFRTGIDLTQQRFPSSGEYLFLPDAASAIERARLVVKEWKEVELRDRAIGFLKALGQTVQDGQKQLLLRADDYAAPREAIEKVFALLRRMPE